MRGWTTNSLVEAACDDYLIPIWKSLDVPVERASGCTLEDFSSNEYLDVFSGISVTSAGHSNETVAEIITKQLEEFVHDCSYIRPNRSVADLAKIIAEVTPGDLQKILFYNSGTEAVKGATKLVRECTGSKEVISLEMGFRDRTLGSLVLAGSRAYKRDMAPTIDDMIHTAPPYAYHCPRCDGDTYGVDCADALGRVIGSYISGNLAAVVVRPVVGEADIVVPSEAWLRCIRDTAHDHDALLIVDEAQTGCGRTDELLISKQFGVKPDILTQAKGIANGLPLGTFTVPADIADTSDFGDHLSTFGSNPVACVAVLATIERLQSGTIGNAYENGEWLSAELTTLESDYDAIGEARNLGLMQGIELMDPETTSPQYVTPTLDRELAAMVNEHLREESNVVIGVGGYYKNVMHFQPPLAISQAQLGETVDALRTAPNDLAQAACINHDTRSRLYFDRSRSRGLRWW